MNQPTVESLFGANAGIIWKTLNQNGPSNLSRLVKSTSLSRKEVFGDTGCRSVSRIEASLRAEDEVQPKHAFST